MLVHGLTPILNVRDIGQSFAWFEGLGWQRGFSWNAGGIIGEGPTAASENQFGPAGFGSVCSGAVSIFLCCGGQGSQGTILPRFPGDNATDGVWLTWWLATPDDVNQLHATALQQGLLITMPPKNEPWGVREFHLRHPDGHTFRISSGLGTK